MTTPTDPVTARCECGARYVEGERNYHRAGCRHGGPPSPLEVIKSDDYAVVLRQPEFSDAWEFQAKWDGCVNFTQRDPDGKETIWEHLCDLDLMIAMLQQVKAERDARFPKARDVGA